jgi:hypothetical protein
MAGHEAPPLVAWRTTWTVRDLVPFPQVTEQLDQALCSLPTTQSVGQLWVLQDWSWERGPHALPAYWAALVTLR